MDRSSFEFQSPSNRVIVPNTTLTASIDSAQASGFNPLVIGS